MPIVQVPKFQVAAAFVLSLCASLLCSPASGQTPAETLADAQALVASGDKHGAAALLAERLPSVPVDFAAADDLLLWTLETYPRDRPLRELALSRVGQGQAIRLEAAAETGGARAKVRMRLLERWREAGGESGETLSRLARLQAEAGSADAPALATLASLAEPSADDNALAAALTTPDSPEALDAAWELAQARRANGAGDRSRAALNQYIFGTEQAFFAAMLEDEEVSAATKAVYELRLCEALRDAGRWSLCQAKAAALAADESRPGAERARASYLRAEAMALTGDYSGSIDAMWEFATSHPEHELTPGALHSVGLSLTRSHQRALALTQFELVVELYPESNAAFLSGEYIRQWSDAPDFDELRAQADAAVASLPPDARRFVAEAAVREWLALAAATAYIPPGPPEREEREEAAAAPSEKPAVSLSTGIAARR